MAVIDGVFCLDAHVI